MRKITVRIEGKRGAGKSTVGLMLYRALQANKISVKYTCGDHNVAQELSFPDSEMQVRIVEDFN